MASSKLEILYLQVELVVDLLYGVIEFDNQSATGMGADGYLIGSDIIFYRVVSPRNVLVAQSHCKILVIGTGM